MTQNSSVNFKLIHFLLWIKRYHLNPNFETFKCSGENFPYSSSHFPNQKSVFLQILHHSSVSWKVTSLYFFKSNVIYFAQKEPIKKEILRISSAQIKIHQILVICETRKQFFLVRTNKMVNCLGYHPCPSRLAPRIHPFTFLWTPLSLSRMLVEFFLKLLYSRTCGKIFKFMELSFLENALIQGIFTHVPLHSKLAPKFLSSRPRQKEITPCPRQHSFENLFFPIAERDGGNYDLLYQNWVRKYEDYFEH